MKAKRIGISRHTARAGERTALILLGILVASALSGPILHQGDPGWGTAHALLPADDVRPEAVPFPGDRPAIADPTRLAPEGRGAEWDRFRGKAGPTWTARFNDLTGAPHRAWGAGLSVARGPVVSEEAAELAAREFIEGHADLLACNPSDLRLERLVDRNGRYILVFQQTHQGIPVEGGRVDVRMNSEGEVILFGSDFYPGVDVSSLPSFSAEEAVSLAAAAVGFDHETDVNREVELRVLPVVRGKDVEYHLTFRVVQYLPLTPALWVSYIDAHTGETIWRHDDLKYLEISGVVDGEIQPELPTDPYEDRPFIHLEVTLGAQDTVVTDETGAYSFPVPMPGTYPVGAELKGDFVDVNNDAGDDASFGALGMTGTPLDIHWDDTNSQIDERDGYFHTVVAHDSIKSIDPGLTIMDYRMPCRVSMPQTCNAYWDGNGINFFSEGDGCANTAQIPDVVYHEYGHGITQWTYYPYNPTGAMHEGFSDYFACTITGQALVGRGFLGPGTWLRTLDNDMVYPDSLSGEVHHDGLIIGGALWHMRENFVGSLGDHQTAVRLADSLFHYARYGFSANFYDYFIDLVMEDDDDADLGNGTPHGIDIYQAFGRHGIGPGLYLSVDHDSLKDTESAHTPITVEAAITSVLPLRADSLLVHYRTLLRGEGETWSAYQALTLDPAAQPHLYDAVIPGQPESTLVNYYLTAQSDTLDLTTVVPPEGALIPYIFYVGPDLIPPRIAHDPVPSQSADEWPPAVAAIVTDNAALASAVLEYQRNGTPQAPIPMSPTGNQDEWSAAFPAGAVSGDCYEYRIVATDASAAANVAVFPYQGYISLWVGDVINLVEYDLESGAPGWSHYVVTPDYFDQWHQSTNRNHTPGGERSWKFGGLNIFGRYANYADGALEAPPITLGDHSTLRFWHWMQAEEDNEIQAYDGGILEITTDDGLTWEQLFPQVNGYTHTIIDNGTGPFAADTPCWSGNFDWTETVADLSGYTGTVIFRFRFGSDAGVTGLGWHVDDIVVTAVDVPAAVAEGAGKSLPSAHQLAQNHPNPFNPETRIRFALPQAGPASLTIFDVNGRAVRTLVDGDLPAGYHSARWDGLNAHGERVASGVYFYRLEAEGFSAVRKMTLLK